MAQNKKFGELKSGDIIYMLVDGSFEVLEQKIMGISIENSYNTVMVTFNDQSVIRLSADWNDEYVHQFGDYAHVYVYADKASLADGIIKLKNIIDDLAEKYC